MGRRGTFRRLALGLPTLLGLRQRGFFIPYRYADGLARARAQAQYPAVEALFARRAPAFAEALADLERCAAALEAIGHDTPAPAPRWHQDWFPRLDAALAYAMVRRHRPARIVEVGSGHSTRFIVRAVADGALATRITAIDPAPRATLAGLAVEWLRRRVPEVGPEPFATLAPGDLLFVDSSHILMPGSDVDFLLNQALPILPRGALVHLHDVFLPDDYPPDWQWRGYNEQTALVLPLLCDDWEVLFASHYVVTRMAAALSGSVAARLPLLAGARESSLWLRRVAGATVSAAG